MTNFAKWLVVLVFIFAASGSTDGLTSSEDARLQLGVLRQHMIQIRIRPEIGRWSLFHHNYDLTTDGQQLFSALRDNRLSIEDLQILATEIGFDLEAAKIELQIWEFLEEVDEHCSLTDHPDLQWYEK